MKRIPKYKVQLVRDGSALYNSDEISEPNVAAEIIQKYLEKEDRENLIVLMLNSKNKVVGINTVSVGSLDGSPAHPREIFKPAILSNAARIILAHNHPSGDTTPSEADIGITNRINNAGKTLGIPMLDHIIVGGENWVSMKNLGYVR